MPTSSSPTEARVDALPVERAARTLARRPPTARVKQVGAAIHIRRQEECRYGR